MFAQGFVIFFPRGSSHTRDSLPRPNRRYRCQMRVQRDGQTYGPGFQQEQHFSCQRRCVFAEMTSRVSLDMRWPINYRVPL